MNNRSMTKANLPQRLGERFSKDNHDLRPAQLRRKGLGVAAAGLLLLGTGGAIINKRMNTVMGSTIPSTETNLNPANYKLEPVPSSGAFGLAENVDPNHDPRNGLIRFQEQLGHFPEPGDVVAVPKVVTAVSQSESGQSGQ